MKTSAPRFVSIAMIGIVSVTAARGQLQKQVLAPNSYGLVLTTTASYTGKGDFKSGDTTHKDISVSTYALQASQTLILSETDAASVNFLYHQNEIQGINASSNQTPLPDRLRSAGCLIEYSHEFDKKWSLAAGLGGVSNAAGNDLLKKGWGVDAYAVAIYKESPNSTRYFGIGYDSLSHDLKVFPVFGFEWTPAPGWTISLGVPKTAVSYGLRSNLTLSLDLSGEDGTYYVENDPKPGVARPSLAKSRMEHKEVRLGFSAAWTINHRIALMGSLGSAVYREFKYLDRDYSLKSKSAAPFASLALCTAY